jgi:hypothetical protein
MPIKDRSLYPPDWDAISLAAKERAGWRCQHPGCGACQYAVGWWRQERGIWLWQPAFGKPGLGQRADGTRWTYSEARECAAFMDWDQSEEGTKPIVIVLTVAHTENPDPSDCRPENLSAQCQRHHLALDHRMHIQNAYASRRAGKARGELF